MRRRKLSDVISVAAVSCCFLSSFSWAGQRAELLILEKDDSRLAFADPDKLQVLARAPAGEDPHEVAVVGARAYISNYGAFKAPLRTLSVVDIPTRRALPAIELGALLAPHGLAVAQQKVYFTVEGSKAIGRYDPASGRIDWVLGLGQDRTHMVVIAPDLSTLWTSNVASNTVSIITRARNDVSGWSQAIVAVGQGPEGFDVAPDRREIWVANSHDGTLSIIDTSTRQVSQRLDLHLPQSNRLKFTPDGGKVLVSDLKSGELVVVDVARRRELERLKLGGGAEGILIEPDGRRAFVAVSPDEFVAVVDLKTLQVTGRIPTGRGPDGMAWVPEH